MARTAHETCRGEACLALGTCLPNVGEAGLAPTRCRLFRTGVAKGQRALIAAMIAVIEQSFGRYTSLPAREHCS